MPVKQYTIEQFMRTIKTVGSSFSHDESSIVVSSDKAGVLNAYEIPIVGGSWKQLTRSNDPTRALSCFPRDSRVLLTRDISNRENSYLYVLEEDGSETLLTPGEQVQTRFMGWSRDDTAFYCATNERDSRLFDLYKIDTTTYQRKLLYQDEAGYAFCGISNNEKYAVFGKTNGSRDSDIYLYQLDAKTMQHLTPHQYNISHRPAQFDVDSRYLYYITDEGSEYCYVMRYELATGRREFFERAAGDIWFTYFSCNGKYRITWVNEGGHLRIRVYETTTNRRVKLPDLPPGNVSMVISSKSESKLAFYISGDRAPSDLYLYDCHSSQITRLTRSLNPEIDPDDLVESEVIGYRSFDGLEIPCLLWKPHGVDVDHKAPALVWIHGGPGGQTRKGYAGRIQYLVNHGYVVLGVNYRGSSGYGKTFFAGDSRKHGREPLWDCIEGKRFLASLGYVDQSRIGIAGASYGGYMVLAALAFHPKEFAIGIDICGISDWVRWLKSLPPHWEMHQRKSLYEKVGDPDIDREMLQATSPLLRAHNIKKPLLVMQSSNDPRVTRDQSDELVKAVKDHGGIVEYLVFDNEGHGFKRRENAIPAYKAMLDFLDHHLKVQSHLY